MGETAFGLLFFIILLAVFYYAASGKKDPFTALSEKKRIDRVIKIFDYLSQYIYNINEFYWCVASFGLKKLKRKLGEDDVVIFYDNITEEGKMFNRFVGDYNPQVYVKEVFICFYIKNNQIQKLHIFIPTSHKERYIKPHLKSELDKINEINNMNINKFRNIYGDKKRPSINFNFDDIFGGHHIEVFIDYETDKSKSYCLGCYINGGMKTVFSFYIDKELNVNISATTFERNDENESGHLFSVVKNYTMSPSEYEKLEIILSEKYQNININDFENNAVEYYTQIKNDKVKSIFILLLAFFKNCQGDNEIELRKILEQNEIKALHKKYRNSHGLLIEDSENP